MRTKVKVFAGVSLSKLEDILEQWLDKVRPIKICATSATSQSRTYESVTLIVFYEDAE